MGALAPNIFFYRVIDMHSLARGLNLLCILGLRLAVGINSSFLAQLGRRAVRRAVEKWSSQVSSYAGPPGGYGREGKVVGLLDKLTFTAVMNARDGENDVL